MIRHLRFTEEERQAMLDESLDKITLNEIWQGKQGDTIIAHTGFASKGFARLKVTKVFYEGCPTYTVVHFKTEAVS
ncbi:MAG: hypothetical protein WC891_02835 [Actinomycetota bacterium]